MITKLFGDGFRITVARARLSLKHFRYLGQACRGTATKQSVSQWKRGSDERGYRVAHLRRWQHG